MKQLLMDAKQEILSLRRRNEILEAQIGVVTVFAAALGLKRNEGAMTPDIAYLLQQEIDKIEQPQQGASR